MKSILPPYSPPWMRQKRKSPVPSHTDLLPAASCFRIFDRSGFSRAAAAVPSGHESKRRTGKGIERVSVVAFDSGKNKEAVPIGAGTYLDGKCFVWLRQKLLKSVRIPASFFLARQKIFSPICIPSPIGTASKFHGVLRLSIQDINRQQRPLAIAFLRVLSL